jgi:hypothetical protein
VTQRAADREAANHAYNDTGPFSSSMAQRPPHR